MVTDSFLDALEQYAGDVGSFYELRLGSVTWDAALVLSTVASYRGVVGHLATIENVAEEAFLNWYSRSGTFWLGVRQNMSTQQWMHAAGPWTGQLLTFHNWNPLSLFSADAQCAYLNVSNFDLWQPNDCKASIAFLIEYECGPGYAFGSATCVGLGHLFHFDAFRKMCLQIMMHVRPSLVAVCISFMTLIIASSFLCSERVLHRHPTPFYRVHLCLRPWNIRGPLHPLLWSALT